MYPKPVIIASHDNIKEAWKNSRDASGVGGAAGIDGVKPVKFRENLDSNISALRQKLLAGGYSFKPLKPYFIAKSDGKIRVICVPTVENRLVQRLILRSLCLKKIQKEFVERDRLNVLTPNVSFGVKKGTDQGVHAAIRQALNYKKTYPWVLKTDISQFFDKIPRDDLVAKVRARLGRSSLIPLIEAAISSEIQAESKSDSKQILQAGIVRGVGLRQGMPLSPLLSNVILSTFDRKAHRQKIKMVRYADDIIVFCSSEAECESVLSFIDREMSALKLSVPQIGTVNSKTEIKCPEETVLFLGVEIYLRSNGEYAVRIPDSTKNRARAKILEEHGSLSWNLAKGFDYARVVQRLRDIPDGYSSAFAQCTNLDSFKQVLEQDAAVVKRRLLEEIFGCDVFAQLSEEQKQFLGFV
jgi:retron-type reverse transcriptase